LKNDQEYVVNYGSNENSISLREEPTVTSPVTTNVEATTGRLVQDEPTLVGPRVSKRNKRRPKLKSDEFYCSK
jgi:hypothetical protein